jgi:hypothetical protein
MPARQRNSRLEQQPCIMTLLGYAWLYVGYMKKKKRSHAREEIEVNYA